MASLSKKDKFFEVLGNIFTGAEIQGDSGYVNLMRIKSRYYRAFKQNLEKNIQQKLSEVGYAFQEELYSKLFTFFKKYFSESGSVYFSYTPLQEKVYERIYRDDKDVMLFWKTHMLYYVKTERLFKNMDAEDEMAVYHFDVANLEHKKNNEKKDLVFELTKAEETDKRHIFFSVVYSKNGSKTKTEEICKKIKKENGFRWITEKHLEKAFSVFNRQSEVDYFISKNAREFLREQFRLWMKSYLLDDETQFDSARLKQLKALQSIAFDIIDLVSQFEDELVKIWNKPKFAHSSNYVITIDKIAEKDFGLLEKICRHKGIGEQIKEWLELGIVNDKFAIDNVFETDLHGKKIKEKWQYLPLDTKYIKDLELDILALFDDLDNQLDGWLIHSENYQALNAVKSKFHAKIQSVFIDPPFNLADSDQFDYRTNYKDASWLTLLENRLSVSKSLLCDTGSFMGRCDHNGNMYFRKLLDKIFDDSNYRNEITINRFQKKSKGLTNTTERLFFYSKSDNSKFIPVTKTRQCVYCKSPAARKWQWSHSAGASDIPKEFLVNEKWELLYPPKGRHWTNSQEKIRELTEKGQMRINTSISYTDCNGKKMAFCPERLQDEDVFIDDNWTDIPGYEFGVYTFQNFSTQNSELLLKRVIQLTTEPGDIFLDYFMGSATAQAVAQKLGRRWIGVEMGEHFYTIDIPRMKLVLSGDKGYISTDADVNWKGGGFFKYFALEQYEETLRNATYEDKNAIPSQDIYHQYLFFKDLKMADKVMTLDEESQSIKADLSKLHKDIDIAETLSHLTGKFIRQIRKQEVVFADGTVIDLNNIDYKIVKPLIWW